MKTRVRQYDKQDEVPWQSKTACYEDSNNSNESVAHKLQTIRNAARIST